MSTSTKRATLDELRRSLADRSPYGSLLRLPPEQRSGFVSFKSSARSLRAAFMERNSLPLSDPLLAAQTNWGASDQADLDAMTVRSRIARLDVISRTTADAEGVRTLALGLGIVGWRDGERIRLAPMQIVPVSHEVDDDDPSLRQIGAPTLNEAVLERLGLDESIFIDDTFDAIDDALRRLKNIELIDRAILGLFNPARYRLWQRLDTRRDRHLLRNPIARRLLDAGPIEPWPDPPERIVKGQNFRLSNLDRSQNWAVTASRQRKSFVVQGPPGTGKTQAIIHILANAALDARPVLFLSGRTSALRAASARLRGSIFEQTCIELFGDGFQPRSIADRYGLAPVGTIVDAMRSIPIEQRPGIVMVTPASYVMNVPQEWCFALLIVDEASLVELAEVLPAVAASDQIVICGDTQQMQKDPPLQVLFDAETPHVPHPNLLEAAVAAGMPDHWLSHHYRSRHPSLMHGSNWLFYNARMRMAPSPRRDDKFGLRSVKVAGRFDRDTSVNRIEAEAVVAEIERHFASQNKASLGVVTMTFGQLDLVRRLLIEKVDKFDRHVSAEEIPVFHYSEIQGEERDIIFISMTFGPQGDNLSWPTSYGDLSLPGGDKRLNVMMTRSRDRTVLFTSFPSSSVSAGRTAGHDALLTFMTLAEHGLMSEPPVYQGPLSSALFDACWREPDTSDFGNAIGVKDNDGEYLAALYPTGRTDFLTEQSEIEQYRIAGWRVIEISQQEVEAAARNLKSDYQFIAELRDAKQKKDNQKYIIRKFK